MGLLRLSQPERIQGAQYTVKSDVWSLGISLIELALGRFPFSESASDDDSDLSDFEGTLSPARPVPLEKKKQDKSKESKRNRRKSRGVSLQGGGMTMSILELLQHIVNEPAPRLTSDGRFPKMAEDFVNSCLLKDPDQRRTPKDLLVRIGTPVQAPTIPHFRFFFLFQNHEWIVHAIKTTFDLEAWASTF